MRVIGKSDFKVEETKALWFSVKWWPVRVPCDLLHSHPLIIYPSLLEVGGDRDCRQFSPERWATNFPLR